MSEHKQPRGTPTGLWRYTGTDSRQFIPVNQPQKYVVMTSTEVEKDGVWVYTDSPKPHFSTNSRASILFAYLQRIKPSPAAVFSHTRQAVHEVCCTEPDHDVRATQTVEIGHNHA